jgi:hypothetical protein
MDFICRDLCMLDFMRMCSDFWGEHEQQLRKSQSQHKQNTCSTSTRTPLTLHHLLPKFY